VPTLRRFGRRCWLLPPLVMGLLYLRGLYRTRLRALVLDGVAPVVSAVSVAAMTVAMLGLFVNGRVPSQTDWVQAWLFALLAVGVLGGSCSRLPSAGARKRGSWASRC
jgi:hypothetical protein